MTAPARHPEPRPFLVALAALAPLAGVLGACSWNEGPVRRHFILGLGVVDTARAPAPADGAPGTRAERAIAAGLLLACGPVHTGLLIGVAERTTLEAPPDASAILHASRASSGTPLLSITAIPSTPSPQEPHPCAPSPP